MIGTVIVSLISVFTFIFLSTKINNLKIENDRLKTYEKELKELIEEKKQLVNEEILRLEQKREEIKKSVEYVVEAEHRIIELEKEKKLKELIDAMEETFCARSLELENNFKASYSDFLSKLNNVEADIDCALSELKKLKQQRNSINESIILERKKDMERDFHKIIFSNQVKEDIQYLLSIETKFNNKEILGKLIYEFYLKTPLLDMEKRVLENKEFSGIYKITSSDGRAYIGKAVNIKQRWQAHCKESLGIGKISHSSIHTAMKEIGWDDFTFEVLEQCNKEELGMKEKYYIDFYETKTHGWNMKGGG